MNKTNDTEDFNTSSRSLISDHPKIRPLPTVASTHGLVRTLLRSVVLGGVGCLAIAALVDVARPEPATDDTALGRCRRWHCVHRRLQRGS